MAKGVTFGEAIGGVLDRELAARQTELTYRETEELFRSIMGEEAQANGATHFRVNGDTLFLWRPARGVYADSGLYAQTVRTRLQDYRENPWVITGDGSLPMTAMPIVA